MGPGGHAEGHEGRQDQGAVGPSTPFYLKTDSQKQRNVPAEYDFRGGGDCLVSTVARTRHV